MSIPNQPSPPSLQLLDSAGIRNDLLPLAQRAGLLLTEAAEDGTVQTAATGDAPAAASITTIPTSAAATPAGTVATSTSSFRVKLQSVPAIADAHWFEHVAPDHVPVRFHLPRAAELVVLPSRSETQVSHAADLLVQLGLSITLAPARPGLVIDRVRHANFNEGLALLGEGVPAERIEQAALDATVPVRWPCWMNRDWPPPMRSTTRAWVAMAAAAGMTMITAMNTNMAMTTSTTTTMGMGTIMHITTMRHTATRTIMNKRTTRGMPATSTATGRTGMKHMGIPTPKDAAAPATHTRMQTRTRTGTGMGMGMGTAMTTTNTATHMLMTMDTSMHTVTGMNITGTPGTMTTSMSIMSTRRIIHTTMGMHTPTSTRMTTTHTTMAPQNPPGRP